MAGTYRLIFFFLSILFLIRKMYSKKIFIFNIFFQFFRYNYFIIHINSNFFLKYNKYLFFIIFNYVFLDIIYY